MKRTTLWIGLGLLLFSSCSNSQKRSYIHRLVNPFVGTGGHGHTFPGPVAPTEITASPDTRIYGWVPARDITIPTAR